MAKDGNALQQCMCGHERHEGRCGKPRYSSTDVCRCEYFIDAGPVWDPASFEDVWGKVRGIDGDRNHGSGSEEGFRAV